MRSVIANFRPREFWYGLDSPSPEFIAAGGDRTNLYGVAFKPRTAGDAFDFGGMQVRVLNPQPEATRRQSAEDDESMVLRLQYGDTSALLVGDSHKTNRRDSWSRRIRGRTY